MTRQNPVLEAQLGVLLKIKAMVERIQAKECIPENMEKGLWTEEIYGKDHAYETVIVNLERMILNTRFKIKIWEEEREIK